MLQHKTFLFLIRRPKQVQNTESKTNSMELVIEAGGKDKAYWKDLWRYRELFYILAWRDLKVRYKQTVVGAAWSIIRPVLTTIVFTIVFSRIAKLSAPGA